MDHVELKAYPFPNGVDVPRLMPFQEFPFNGDGYLAAEVLRLKEAHGLKCALETGTCLGSTALWLADNFDTVDTIEVNRAFAEIAKARIGERDWCGVTVGNSVDHIGDYASDNGDNGLIFLDAHWSTYCPLLDELKEIHQWCESDGYFKPCIVIHDFQVPGTDFGYDKMPDGRHFNIDLIRTHLDAIYGEGGWKHNYPTNVEGARRGWISIEPVQP